MKKKLLFFSFLLISILGLFTASPASAMETEEMKYMKYIDEKYVVDCPSFTIGFSGKPVYDWSLSLNPMKWIRIDGFKYWEWNYLIFFCDFSITDLAVLDVGFHLSDMVCRFDLTYLVSLDGVTSESNYTYDVPLSDVYNKKNTYINYMLDYEELLSFCPVSDFDYVVIDEIAVTIYSKILDRCGSTYFYDFVYLNNDYSNCVLSGIEQFRKNAQDGVFYLGNLVERTWDVTSKFGTFFSIHSEDEVRVEFFDFYNFLESFVKNLPDILIFLVKFCIQVINLLPAFICSCVPFLPEYLVYSFMYVLYFALVVGVWKLLKG